ncbi:MAG TPA: hypothetical protein VHD62_17695 [Opitutaceae bacterium]|nr:hypothetical protein [Opitutaceae bacterium]
MKRETRKARVDFGFGGFLLFAFGAAGAVALAGGCLVYHAVAAPVKLAATGVTVAGETAGAVVTSTGKVAVSAVRAAGNVGSGGIDAASRLAQAGMVTFVDAASGTIVRVPWREGLTLAGAGAEARLAVAQRAVEIVRAGRVVYSAASATSGSAPVASGDVVRLRG